MRVDECSHVNLWTSLVKGPGMNPTQSLHSADYIRWGEEDGGTQGMFMYTHTHTHTDWVNRWLIATSALREGHTVCEENFWETKLTWYPWKLLTGCCSATSLGHCVDLRCLCFPRWASLWSLLPSLWLLCPSLNNRIKPFSILFNTEQQADIFKNYFSANRSKSGKAEFSKLWLTLVPGWGPYRVPREPVLLVTAIHWACPMCQAPCEVLQVCDLI